MPSIGLHCHELRVSDKDTLWRIVYRIDVDAITIDICKRRFRMYDDAIKQAKSS